MVAQPLVPASLRAPLRVSARRAEAWAADKWRQARFLSQRLMHGASQLRSNLEQSRSRPQGASAEGDAVQLEAGRAGLDAGADAVATTPADVEEAQASLAEASLAEASLAEELGLTELAESLSWHAVMLQHQLGLESKQQRRERTLGGESAVAAAVACLWVSCQVVNLAAHFADEDDLACSTLRTLLVWLAGSTVVWLLMVLLSGGHGASRRAWEGVLTTVGCSSLIMAAFVAVSAAFLLAGQPWAAWVARALRVAGLVLATRRVGIACLRLGIHGMNKHILVCYPILLIFALLLN